MKLWIRYEKIWGENRLGTSIKHSKEEALLAAEAHNKYLFPFEHPATSVQEVEVDSDYLLIQLLNTFDANNWRQKLLSMIDKKDPNIKFGELVEVPAVEHIVLD